MLSTLRVALLALCLLACAAAGTASLRGLKSVRPRGPFDTFCVGKSDGLYCGGDILVSCAAQLEYKTEVCNYGPDLPPYFRSKCIPDDANGYHNAQCKGPTPAWPDSAYNFCVNRTQGNYCDGDTLVSCISNLPYKTEMCNYNQNVEPARRSKCIADVSNGYKNAKCVAAGTPSQTDPAEQMGLTGVVPRGPFDSFCGGKSDGLYCGGDILVSCVGQLEYKTEMCNYNQNLPPYLRSKCIPDDANGYHNARCQAPTPAWPDSSYNFCVNKTEGNYCDGDTLVTCAGKLAYKTEMCNYNQNVELARRSKCIADVSNGYNNAQCG